MGTKLEYCAIYPLASSQNSNSYSFTVQYIVDDYFRTRSAVKENCQTIGSMDGFRSSSMDRLLERHNMESIKNTMQMHEDIFKHQVRELHRLYSVQKMLMQEVKKEMKENRLWTCSAPMTSSVINQSQFSKLQKNGEGDGRSRERSESCSGGGDTMKVQSRGFDLERLAEDQDISAKVSAIEEDEQAAAGPSCLIMHSSRLMNQISIEGCDEDSEIELTLSIGGSSSKKTAAKNSKPHSHSHSHSHCHSHSQEVVVVGCTSTANSQSIFQKEVTSSEDCSGPNTPISSSSATFDRERKRPHWLFQGLSINRT